MLGPEVLIYQQPENIMVGPEALMYQQTRKPLW